jgi:hypothetical protein
MGKLKNLLVYISPRKEFSEECKILAKVQIHNSYHLGWKPEDIVVVTNFPWEQGGVKAIVVEDEHYYSQRPRSIKTAIIPYLIDQGIIEKGKIYWNHDFDAYQQSFFDLKELDLADFDVGLTDYGWRDRWCLGSFFIKTDARDIFEKARPIIYKDIEDETAMMELTEDVEIAKRCKRLNITYNFGMRHVESNWEKAEKPLKVVHFHPHYKLVDTLGIFMYGRNGLHTPLIDKRLRRIFNHYGIK